MRRWLIVFSIAGDPVGRNLHFSAVSPAAGGESSVYSLRILCEQLDPGATIRSYRIVRQEGGREVVRQIEHYNLDAVLAVGYRVRSQRGTQFRRWATQRLREYLVKGFVLDDERLKNPPAPGLGVPDYFDEMQDTIKALEDAARSLPARIRSDDKDGGAKP